MPQAKAKKSAKKAKAKTKGKKKTGASKKKAADPVDEPDKPKSAKMFYAIEVRKEVLAKNKGKSKPELMMIIKKQYSALTDAKKKKYITMVGCLWLRASGHRAPAGCVTVNASMI